MRERSGQHTVWYGAVKSGGASDLVTVYYNHSLFRTNPIVIDVRGSNLYVYGGNTAKCASSCTTNISTSATSAPASKVAIGSVITDGRGESLPPVTAGAGWTQIPTASPGMSGEYST